MARRPKTAIESQLSGKPITQVVHINGKDVPQIPLDGLPICPKGTSKMGKLFWNEIISNLYDMKVISKTDQPAMYSLLKAYEDLIRAISDNEWFLKNNNPDNCEDYIKMRLQFQKAYVTAEENFNKLMAKFGMTPVDRNSLPIMPKKEEEKDPLAILLGE